MDITKVIIHEKSLVTKNSDFAVRPWISVANFLPLHITKIYLPMSKEFVYIVDTVDAQGDETTITITATGQTNRGGWTGAELVSRGTPTDGNYEFDFMAEPPTGPSPDVFTEITASTEIPYSADIITITVYSATNEKVWGAP